MAISFESNARPQVAPAPSGAPQGVASSATETRLRLIIESAPVSLTITTQDGTILAANARALRLFQVDRLESLVGTKFDRLVAADDRERVAALLDGVCKGNDARLTYRVGEGDGQTVEMRAVPLRRDGAAAAVCLGAAWEVTQPAAAAPAPAVASSPALEQELEEARSALAALTRTREAERLAVGDALIQTRQRLQAALAEAEERHAQASAQWTAERTALQTDLAQAREATGSHTSRLAEIQAEAAAARDAAAAAAAQLKSAHAELMQARDVATAASSQLASAQGELEHVRRAATTTSAQLAAVSADLDQTREAALMTAAQLATSNEQRQRAEEQLEAARQRIAELEGAARELEQQCAQMVADRQSDRVEFHEMVRTERSKYEAVRAAQARRDAALAEIARLLQDASERTVQLVGDAAASASPVAPAAPAAAAHAPQAPHAPHVKAAEPPAAPQAQAPDGIVEEDSWQF